MVNEVITEIGYDTVNRASDVASGWYAQDANYEKWDVFKAIKDIRGALDYYTNYDIHNPIKGIENNPMYQAACKGLDAVEAFFTKKGRQQNNFYNRAEDMRNEYVKEFETKALEMFPETAGTKGYWEGRPDPSKLTDEMYDQVVSQLSPKAKEYIDTEGW